MSHELSSSTRPQWIVITCIQGHLLITSIFFFQLAYEAFKKAQACSPESVEAWVGHALIAERIGSSESMDLFRHATELHYHVCCSIASLSCLFVVVIVLFFVLFCVVVLFVCFCFFSLRLVLAMATGYVRP